MLVGAAKLTITLDTLVEQEVTHQPTESCSRETETRMEIQNWSKTPGCSPQEFRINVILLSKKKRS